MSADEDGGVGYRKPPKAHRFGAGNSGNKKGRPRGSKNTKTLAHQIAHERQVVQENGATVGYTIVELLFMTLQRKAMSGDVRAIKLLDRYRTALGQEAGETQGGFLVVPEPVTMEEWERRSEAHRARMAYDRECRKANR